jgi:hypothetical protein
LAKEIGELNVKIGLDSTGFQNGIYCIPLLLDPIVGDTMQLGLN